MIPGLLLFWKAYHNNMMIDSEQKPPFSREEYQWVNDRLFKITYLVSNGYGGTKIISKWSVLVKDDKEISRIAYENKR